LLTAQDVIEQLRERTLGEQVVLPRVMFGGPEGESLDGYRPEQIATMLDLPVIVWDGSEGTGRRAALRPYRRRASSPLTSCPSEGSKVADQG